MKKTQNGFTLVELLIVVAIIGIIAAIAIPGLMRARQAGNEASAIGSLRAINSAQALYAASCGNGGYASDIAALVLAPTGGQPFLGRDLATGIKSGYIIAITPSGVPNGARIITPAGQTCNMAATDAVAGYFASAIPESVGSTGQRSYATDSAAAIYRDDTGAAIQNPIPLGATILQ